MNEIKIIELPKLDKKTFKEYGVFERRIQLEIQELFFVPEKYLGRKKLINLLIK